MRVWFDHSPCAASAAVADPAERCLRTTPAALAQWLPKLGGVLYLPSRDALDAFGALPQGLLGESLSVMPLLRTRQLRVRSAIGADGPREWVECRDIRGELVAQLHLLPDTDYLAWDNPPGVMDEGLRSRSAGLFHAATARIVSFRRRVLATLVCLDEAPAPGISGLGYAIARTIVGSRLPLA